VPFSLHPSGYCVWFNESSQSNLIQGEPCRYCKRIAGHSVECPAFVYREDKGKSSRPKLFNATSILWASSKEKSFLTFTLPTLSDGTYQRDYDCPETGDLYLASKFSKVLEAYSLREKRKGLPLSYTWVAEAQMKRKDKHGGIGDLHYHLIVNKRIKADGGRVIDKDTLTWLQNIWCEHIGANAKNCLDVRPLPDGIDSVPGYVSKYLGKGSQRMILSRQFGASRDLTRFKPIQLRSLPECDLINEYDCITPTGYEVSVKYFNTRQVLELYGADMAFESQINSSRTDRNFTEQSILDRKIRRFVGSSYST